MFKQITEAIYNGSAYLCELAALGNIGTTSWIFLYQPDVPKE